jgi:hypothetical protein
MTPTTTTHLKPERCGIERHQQFKGSSHTAPRLLSIGPLARYSVRTTRGGLRR